MRFTIPALNNDYFDEDYLKVFNFRSMGKNVKCHRSVVFKTPADVSIGDNVYIGPYCIFDEGKIDVASGSVLAGLQIFTGSKGGDDDSGDDAA